MGGAKKEIRCQKLNAKFYQLSELGENTQPFTYLTSVSPTQVQILVLLG